MKKLNILVTGGCGYIGSHTVIQLIESGASITILDNLVNSKKKVLDRIHKITGVEPNFILGDVRDGRLLNYVFKSAKYDFVIHFAGLKSVSESFKEPINYYDNNVRGSLVLLKEMGLAGIKSFVFSSSATVYGDPASVPITENFPLKTTNPYGESKLMIEHILGDIYKSDPSWRISILRYFNPVGAHESGLIGEDPNSVPNNLMPYISQVATGKLKRLAVYGKDYPTPDGTGVRDYIHVDDLASGHLAAIRTLNTVGGFFTVNLGTGHGYSVLDVIRAFEKASGKIIPFDIVDRRSGDVASCYANPQRAIDLFGWVARHGIERMCIDAWRWQANNPEGIT